MQWNVDATVGYINTYYHYHIFLVLSIIDILFIKNMDDSKEQKNDNSDDILNWNPPNREQQINANEYKNAIKRDKQKYNNKSSLELIYKFMDYKTKIVLFEDKLWNKCFQFKTKPSYYDWLYTRENERKGQTFDQWIKTVRHLPNSLNNKIGLITIGKFNINLNINGEMVNLIDILSEYINIFYGMKVKVLNGVEVNKDQNDISTRFTTNLQLKTGDIHYMLSKVVYNNPDLFCVVGVTLIDLYPNESWNYVFGQAVPLAGTGIFSFARYLPGFSEGKVDDIINNKATDPNISKYLKTKKDQILFIRRCLQVLSHEIGHLFNLYHCIYFECLLNGSNHLNESDKTPLQLCPLCLHKLYIAKMKNVNQKYIENPNQYYIDLNETKNNNNNDNSKPMTTLDKLKYKMAARKQSRMAQEPFDLFGRYLKLQKFYKKIGLTTDQEWCEKRVMSFMHGFTKTYDSNDIDVSELKLTENVYSFFVYGTLRDDDDSGAFWSKGWISDTINSQTGTLNGFKILKNRRENFPFAIRTDNNDDYIVGRLLTWKKDVFIQKLLRADQIEGYNPKANENDCFYLRKVVNVQTTNNDIMQAYVYYQKPKESLQDLLQYCDILPQNDWLKRHLLSQ